MPDRKTTSCQPEFGSCFGFQAWKWTPKFRIRLQFSWVKRFGFDQTQVAPPYVSTSTRPTSSACICQWYGKVLVYGYGMIQKSSWFDEHGLQVLLLYFFFFFPLLRGLHVLTTKEKCSSMLNSEAFKVSQEGRVGKEGCSQDVIDLLSMRTGTRYVRDKNWLL